MPLAKEPGQVLHQEGPPAVQSEWDRLQDEGPGRKEEAVWMDCRKMDKVVVYDPKRDSSKGTGALDR